MARLVVEKEKILKNAAIVIREVVTANIIAVVKGNGYGLSLVPYVRVLKEGGITFFAVSELSDCARLRDAGISDNLLLMTPLVDIDEVKTAIKLDVIMTVASHENAILISGAANELEKEARVHIKVDTGFGRYGFDASEIEKIATVYSMVSAVKVEGIFSHLSDAFGKNKKHTLEQCQVFEKILKELQTRSINPGMRHILNSCGMLRFKEYRYDAVRVGSAFTGRLPVKNRWGFERVGFLECCVVSLRWLKKGRNVGYGNVMKIKRPTLAAVLDAGYFDGFCLEKSKDTFRLRDCLRYMRTDFKKLFSQKISVTVKNKRAALLGRVAMTSTTVDVTKIECAVGDSAKMNVNPLFVGEHVERLYV